MRTMILTTILVAIFGFNLSAQSIERSAITSGAGEATSVFGETVQFSIGDRKREKDAICKCNAKVISDKFTLY